MTRPKPPGTELHASPTRPTRVGRTATRYAETQTHTVRVIPPVQRLLQTLEAIADRELQRMMRRQAEDANVQVNARDLDALASALRKAYDTQRQIDEDYAEEMSAASDEELAALERGDDDDD